MVDYTKWTYEFEDSLNVPQFKIRPSIVSSVSEASSAELEFAEGRNADYEHALRQLGSCPTNFPKVIGAGDFAGMIADIESARSDEEKAEILTIWSGFFNGTLSEALCELANSIREGDMVKARKLIARVCA